MEEQNVFLVERPFLNTSLFDKLLLLMAAVGVVNVEPHPAYAIVAVLGALFISRFIAGPYFSKVIHIGTKELSVEFKKYPHDRIEDIEKYGKKVVIKYLDDDPVTFLCKDQAEAQYVAGRMVHEAATFGRLYGKVFSDAELNKINTAVMKNKERVSGNG